MQHCALSPAASMTSRYSRRSRSGRRLHRTNQLPLAFHRQPTDEFSVMILSLSDDLSSDMPRRRAMECRTLRHKLPKLNPGLAARAQWKTRINQHNLDSLHSTIPYRHATEVLYSIYTTSGLDLTTSRISCSNPPPECYQCFASELYIKHVRLHFYICNR
ncbi:unnamed protein product, partial [Brenthis ino]